MSEWEGKVAKIHPCIYEIVNLINKKVYIGSTMRIAARKLSHFSALRLNKHSSVHLQNAFNKYGEENFQFNILEELKYNNESIENFLSILLERENYWIEKKKSTNKNFGYNSRVEASSNFGVRWPEESKKKFSEKKKGQKWTKNQHKSAENSEKVKTNRKNFSKRIKNWRENNPEKVKESAKKGVKTRRNKYTDKEWAEYYQNLREKSRKTFIQNHCCNIYCYLPNGELLKEFNCYADVCRFLEIDTRNSLSITNRLDRFFFKGLIFSLTKYIKYPENLLKTITCGNHKYYVCVSKNSISLVDSKDLYQIGFTKTQIYSNKFPLIKNDYIIYNIAPIIGNDNNEVGEFIESLYKKKTMSQVLI